MKLVYRGKEYDTNDTPVESKDSSSERLYRGVKYTRTQGKGWQLTSANGAYRGVKFKVDQTGRILVAS